MFSSSFVHNVHFEMSTGGCRYNGLFLYSIYCLNNKQEVVVIMILSSRREDATPADGKILSFSVVSDTVHGMV